MKRPILTCCLGLALLCFGFISASGLDLEKAKKIKNLFEDVKDITPVEAAKLEEKLAKDPDDIPATARVIGYYVMQLEKNTANKSKIEKYYFQLIRRHPDADILCVPMGIIIKHMANFEELKKCWEEAIASHPGNVKIIANAASSISVGDFALSLKYWRDVCKIEPDNPKWHVAIADEYQTNMLVNRATADGQEMAEKAFDELTIAYELADAKQKNDILPDVCRLAFDARDFEASGKYADLMLASISADRKGPNDGMFVYFGNQFKGRLVLEKGDISLAEQYLLKSGDTSGNAAIDILGPSMLLANELLKQGGSREVVIEFLEKCGKFWNERKKLDQWIAAVKSGKTPNFGANLVF